MGRVEEAHSKLCWDWKVTALTSALCRLHNFCIDENQSIEPMMQRDSAQIATGPHLAPVQTSATGTEEHNGPPELVGGGEHFDDVSRYTRRQMENATEEDGSTPRDKLVQSVIEQDIHRPV